MEIFKNIKSGHYFILMRDIDRQTGLFITPTNEVKALNYNFFSPIDEEVNSLIKGGELSPDQIRKFDEFQSKSDDDPFWERFSDDFEEKSKPEQNLIIEKLLEIANKKIDNPQ